MNSMGKFQLKQTFYQTIGKYMRSKSEIYMSYGRVGQNSSLETTVTKQSQNRANRASWGHKFKKQSPKL